MSEMNSDSSVSLNEGEDYRIFADEARRIIDQLVQYTLAHVNDLDEQENVEIPNQTNRFIQSENDDKITGYSSIQWPTIDEFIDEKLGLNKIHEYIEKEWKTSSGSQDPCWLYAIDFLERKSLEFTDLYIYRVCYSIPTCRQPISRHTASIYFTIDVSKIKSKNQPVKVSFVFESIRMIHHPSNFRFRQTWLEDILLLKEKLLTDINF